MFLGHCFRTKEYPILESHQKNYHKGLEYQVAGPRPLIRCQFVQYLLRIERHTRDTVPNSVSREE